MGNAETDGRTHATRVPTVFENVQRNLSGDGQSAPTRGFAICAAAIRSNWCLDLICWGVTRGQLVNENTSKLQIPTDPSPREARVTLICIQILLNKVP